MSVQLPSNAEPQQQTSKQKEINVNRKEDCPSMQDGRQPVARVSYPTYLQYSRVHYVHRLQCFCRNGFLSPSPSLPRPKCSQCYILSDVRFDEGVRVGQERGWGRKFRGSVLSFQSHAVLTNVQEKLIVLYFPLFEFLGRQAGIVQQLVEDREVPFLCLPKVKKTRSEARSLRTMLFFLGPCNQGRLEANLFI